MKISPRSWSRMKPILLHISKPKFNSFLPGSVVGSGSQEPHESILSTSTIYSNNLPKLYHRAWLLVLRNVRKPDEDDASVGFSPVDFHLTAALTNEGSELNSWRVGVLEQRGKTGGECRHHRGRNPVFLRAFPGEQLRVSQLNDGGGGGGEIYYRETGTWINS